MDKLLKYANDAFRVDVQKNIASTHNGDYAFDRVIEIYNTFPGAYFSKIYGNDYISVYYNQNRTLKYYIIRYWSLENLTDILCEYISPGKRKYD